MNVRHLHGVPLSLYPLGPSGRLHIQNERPRFTPGFVVSRILHGSPCSQLGTSGFAKSLRHDCLDASPATSSTVDSGLFVRSESAEFSILSTIPCTSAVPGVKVK